MFPPIPFSFSLNPIATILRSLFFYAPRTSSITQTRGAGTPTETRATVATVTNNDGYLVTVLSGELREEGARRIYNLIQSSSENFSGASWSAYACTKSATGMLEFATNDVHILYQATIPFVANHSYVMQMEIVGIGRTWVLAGLYNGATYEGYYFNLSGAGAVGASSGTHMSEPEITLQSNGNYLITFKISGTVTLSQAAINGATADGVRSYIGDVAKGYAIAKWQVEDVTAQTTQTAGEYVSVGVLSAPYHGAGVDGVKYFSTDISGNPIPAATLKGALVESAATQYLGVTGTPATQTTASLGTGTYTLWVEGTGSALASAGTATISGEAAATEGSHNTFTVSGAGTVTVTVTGSLTFFQLENSPYPTQRIDNAGAVGTSATRNKDVLDDQVASNLSGPAGTVAFTWTPSHDPSGTIALCGSYVDASNYTALLHDATKYIWRKRIAGVNYDAELTAAYANGTSAKIALTLGASGSNLAVDGTLGTAHANTDDAQLGTRWQWGADGNGGQQAGAAFKEVYLTPRASSDSELQAITV